MNYLNYLKSESELRAEHEDWLQRRNHAIQELCLLLNERPDLIEEVEKDLEAMKNSINPIIY